MKRNRRKQQRKHRWFYQGCDWNDLPLDIRYLFGSALTYYNTRF